MNDGEYFRKVVNNKIWQPLCCNSVKAKHEKVSYSCPYCQKSFSMSAYCQKHIETCKLSVPCICSICNKSFKNSSTLDTHQRTHNRTQCDVQGESKKTLHFFSHSISNRNNLKTVCPIYLKNAVRRVPMGDSVHIRVG